MSNQYKVAAVQAAPVEYLNAPAGSEVESEHPDNEADSGAISGLTIVK